MSSSHDTHSHGGGHADTHSSHPPSHYVKIWAILLVLLLVSICGPMAGIRAVTLFTAFGIAIVKAIMVAREFMHLRYEKAIASYIMVTMLFLMAVFFYGVAPDVMTPGGTNWERLPIQEPIQATATEVHE